MPDAYGSWTSEAVAARFQEAVITGRRLPPVRVRGYFNSWPAVVRQEWERLATEDRRIHRFPPDPAAIDRMVETMRWAQWLPEEQRHLLWMCAEGRRWRDICAFFACERTTAWRHWQRALGALATRLNEERISPTSKFLSKAE